MKENNTTKFFTEIICSISNQKTKKILRSFSKQYHENNSLTIYQKEILTIEAIKQHKSIPPTLKANHIIYHLLPSDTIIKFIDKLSNNNEAKFRKRLKKISYFYKNCGWLSIKQRETIYIAAYKQKIPIPNEFKKLTSDKDEKEYIDATNNLIIA